jgi:flagellar hook-length control protein FliK
VQAEVAQVRQWLESQQDTLRTALAEHGLRLDRFVVDSEGQRQNASRDPRGESSPRRRQPLHSAQGDQPAFEVVV